jgi:hypothetical protein
MYHNDELLFGPFNFNEICNIVLFSYNCLNHEVSPLSDEKHRFRCGVVTDNKHNELDYIMTLSDTTKNSPDNEIWRIHLHLNLSHNEINKTAKQINIQSRRDDDRLISDL